MSNLTNQHVLLINQQVIINNPTIECNNLTNQHTLLINQQIIINNPTIEYEQLDKSTYIINKSTSNY
jgi:hypothetical protein